MNKSWKITVYTVQYFYLFKYNVNTIFAHVILITIFIIYTIHLRSLSFAQRRLLQVSPFTFVLHRSHTAAFFRYRRSLYFLKIKILQYLIVDLYTWIWIAMFFISWIDRSIDILDGRVTLYRLICEFVDIL